MAKKEIAKVKLQLAAGKAQPAPPVGPALGQHGVNIMEFCKAFNAKTQAQMAEGLIIPAEITIYADRSFTFVLKSPPASVLILKKAGVPKGSGVPNRDKVGSINMDDVRSIAETKMEDLNANDMEMACRIIKGTARSMGIIVNE